MTTAPLLGCAGGAELRARLLAGDLSCRELAEALLAAIGDDPLHAWAAVEPEALRAQADRLDAFDAERRSSSPLFGVPIAIKDNFDTADHPTAYGSPIYAGRTPAKDAAAVAALRSAGALVAGKATCAEFAWMTAPPTLNPLDPGRTPGGSSSGSAAAVAAGTVPLATGTQTAGSINRPASYCGILGYKPSFGLLSRAGVKLMSQTLDTVGLLGRDLGDIRAAAAALGVRSLEAPADEPPSGRAPRLGFARTELWSTLEPVARGAIDAWLEQARQGGMAVEEVELPGYAELAAAQTTIQLYESARSLAPERSAHPELLSDELRTALEEGTALPRRRYDAALATTATLTPALLARLRSFDAVLTPSAPGPPPLGIEFTGDPLFCRVWTLIGAPSLSLPLAWTPDRLPVPLQLVGEPRSDAAILRAAQVLVRPSYQM